MDFTPEDMEAVQACVHGNVPVAVEPAAAALLLRTDPRMVRIAGDLVADWEYLDGAMRANSFRKSLYAVRANVTVVSQTAHTSVQVNKALQMRL